MVRLLPDGELLRRGGRQGNVLTYNGTSWSSPDEIDPSGANWSPSRARRRASAPRWTTSGHVLTYNGTSWSSPDEIDPSGGA